MPAYSFELKWSGGERNNWAYLPGDDVAREYGRLLAQTFKDSNQYPGIANLTVKDSEGTPLHSIEF
jgi:hypothetical protein